MNGKKPSYSTSVPGTHYDGIADLLVRAAGFAEEQIPTNSRLFKEGRFNKGPIDVHVEEHTFAIVDPTRDHTEVQVYSTVPRRAQTMCKILEKYFNNQGYTTPPFAEVESLLSKENQ